MTAPPAPSLRLRLLLGTLAAVGIALLLAGLFIADLFASHVRRTVEEDLTHHLSELISHTRIGADGQASVPRPLSDPRFQEPGSGMSWRIAPAGRAMLHSTSTIGLDPHSVRTVERAVTLSSAGRPVTFSIREDGRLLDAEIAAFHADLALSLAALAALLGLGVLLQHHYGLRPLARLGDAADALRRGRLDRLPEDVPSEFRSLVARLNELLQGQAVLVSRGRLEAGNLAHGLRTPLALIGDEAERLRSIGQGEAADFIQQQCDAMGRQIDYRMRRAAAGGTGHGAAPVLLAPLLDQILAAMARLHRDMAPVVHVDADPVLAVQADPGDLFEILSNLIDNAFKWAGTRIDIVLRAEDGLTVLTIADDGPGIAPERRASVLTAGMRLDEKVPGHGLGLTIVADLITMNGGQIELGSSPAQGLSVTITLPSVSRL